MSELVRFTPALSRRAFFLLNAVLLATAGFAAAPPAPPPDLAQVGKPNAEEARKILEQFRQSGIQGQYFLEIELQALPRRGATVVYHGRMWGGRNEQGAITRVELSDGAGKVHRFLVQNGERPAVWRLGVAGIEAVKGMQLFEPLIPGLVLTAFDLQMPFLYWTDAAYEKLTRSFRGRPAHVYLFRAPADFPAKEGGVEAARAYLDAQYNALMQTELLGPKGVLKTMVLVDLKKIVDPQSHAEQWIPNSFDVRDEVTRDKTRLLVTGAALNQPLAPSVFQSAALAENIAPPAAERIVRIAP